MACQTRAGLAGTDGQTSLSELRDVVGSPEHRANVLGDYSQIGIDLQTGTLSDSGRTSIWTQHFGSHCEDSPVQG